MRKEIYSIEMREAGEEKLHGQFSARCPWFTFSAVILADFLTGDNTRLAAEAFKLGVAEYLVKPFDVEPTLALLRRTVQCRQRTSDVPRLLEETTGLLPPDFLVGRSPQMRQLLTLLGRVADTDATVLIHGETGVGKELIARALHYNSRLKDKPFIALFCGALPETLFESEMFGYEKGAFTGAQNRKKGRFELAEGGTLFLDEIGDINLATQVKLLRVLQEREYERRHNPIWPELEQVLRDHGVLSYSIFLDAATRDLFGYVEVEDEARWEAIAASPVCRRWWTSMRELMPSNPDHSPVGRELREVFHIERPRS